MEGTARYNRSVDDLSGNCLAHTYLIPGEAADEAQVATQINSLYAQAAKHFEERLLRTFGRSQNWAQSTMGRPGIGVSRYRNRQLPSTRALSAGAG